MDENFLVVLAQGRGSAQKTGGRGLKPIGRAGVAIPTRYVVRDFMKVVPGVQLGVFQGFVEGLNGDTGYAILEAGFQDFPLGALA